MNPCFLTAIVNTIPRLLLCFYIGFQYYSIYLSTQKTCVELMISGSTLLIAETKNKGPKPCLDLTLRWERQTSQGISLMVRLSVTMDK